jgi:hypothetical protein
MLSKWPTQQLLLVHRFERLEVTYPHSTTALIEGNRLIFDDSRLQRHHSSCLTCSVALHYAHDKEFQA